MKLSEFLGRFLYTRKCPSCFELIDYERSDEAFCPECRAKWDREMVKECSACGKAICECICMTKTLRDSGALCHHKAVKYSLATPLVHNTLIFIKKNENPRISGFLASQLASVLRGDEELEGLMAKAVVTNVPRSRAAILKYGHDQSELIAKSLADKLGCEYFALLKRNPRAAKAQKKLDAKERAKNVKNMFEINRDHSEVLDGRAVILVDDIVTTGSSMGACASRLIKAGAGVVICASVATTESVKR